MSNVSIFEKKWIDLVFENKNQEYGAYQLRQENPKTTVTAFIYAVVFLFSISGIGMLLSSFGTKPDVEVEFVSPPIKLTDFIYPPRVEPLVIPATQPKTTIKEDITKKDLTNLVVVTKDDNPDEIKNNNDPKSNPDLVDNGIIGGVASNNQSTGKSPDKVVEPEAVSTNKLESSATIDKLPEFPGGILKFYEFVGTNFEKPELESGTVLTVYVSFVIEKDGKMTDIKVIRTAGLSMDKEAIRVLKSLKTKWEPGIKDRQKVRTLYTLPIKVKSE